MAGADLTPRKLPRQARSKATVDAILEAAAQVFCQLGYSGGTTDKIAARAGVSIGSLYQYFPNKDSLLIDLAKSHMNEGFAIIYSVLKEESANPSGLKQMIEKFVDALVSLHQRAPELHRVLFNEAPLPSSFLREKEKREQAFSEQIKNHLTTYSEVNQADLTVVSYMLVQVTEGLIHSFILFPPSGISADKMREELVKMLHGYLTSGEYGKR